MVRDAGAPTATTRDDADVAPAGRRPSFLPECPDPACRGGPLEVWQPFEADPEFIIGICRECRGIRRLEPGPDGGGWRARAAARPVAVGSIGARKAPGEPIAGGTN